MPQFAIAYGLFSFYLCSWMLCDLKIEFLRVSWIICYAVGMYEILFFSEDRLWVLHFQISHYSTWILHFVELIVPGPSNLMGHFTRENNHRMAKDPKAQPIKLQILGWHAELCSLKGSMSWIELRHNFPMNDCSVFVLRERTSELQMLSEWQPYENHGAATLPSAETSA